MGTHAPRDRYSDVQIGDFDVRSNLRQTLADLKEFNPELAKAVRKQLRAAGDDAIGVMKGILSEPPPGVVTGHTYSRMRDSRGRKRRMISGVRTEEAKRHRSTNARKEIAAGIKLHVVTGKSRTSIRIMASRGTLHRMYNAREWRHPVFGDRNVWQAQAGTRYFTRGVSGAQREIRNRIQDAVEVALEAIADHKSPSLD